MIQLHKFLPFVIFFLTLLGCRRQSEDTTTIENLTNRFPQLKIVSNYRSNDYSLIRSVSFAKPSITIKLYSQPNSVDDKQEIILVTNSGLYSYAIPLFSNTYQDYWMFQFDTLSKNTKPINTTFEKELNICLDTLHLNDTIGTAGKVVNEILYSLLHCRDFDLSESSNFKVILMNINNSIPEEDSDSCYKRLKRNWEIISEEMDPNKAIIYKHSYWDKNNARIYRFDFEKFKRKQKNYFKLSTFRLDCTWHLLTL
ncbi:MAG: hypothetical protein ACM3H8_16390 [Sphingobacteriales bacterium]